MSETVSSPDVSASNPERPRHIAIVMDGNNRWATRKGFEGTAGHREGAKRLKSTVKRCATLGIDALTVFAFSSENWRRPQQEVDELMRLFMQSLDEEVDELNSHDVCLRFIGDLSRFSDELRRSMQQSMQLTAGNQRMTFNVAVNYGGRWDVTQAARRLVAQAMDRELTVAEVDERRLAQGLCLANQPALDLCIRTGGEQRISNFLLWDIAYCELYFTDCLWPDFDDHELDRAIDDYARRQRRFGRTGAQVDAIQLSNVEPDVR